MLANYPDSASFGGVVAAAGDVNADGFADVVVGAINPGQRTGGNYARILFTRPGALVERTTIQPVQGFRGQLGTAVAVVGDMDGDGFSEVAYAGPGRTGSQAVLGIGSGASRQHVGWLYAQDGWHAAVAGVDLDGNGRAAVLDAVPVAMSNTGAVIVKESLVSPGLAVFGGSPGDDFGHDVAAVGDLDGDGFQDVAVGAPQRTAGRGGYVEVLSGQWIAQGLAQQPQTAARRLYRWSDNTPSAGFGFSVGGGGDVDGDGTPDVIVGAPFDLDSNGAIAGRFSVYSGATGSRLSSASYGGSGALTGWAVGILPDADGDGRDDPLIGLPGLTNRRGRVLLLSGTSTSAVIGNWSGDVDGDQFGLALTPMADTNRDGIADVAIGAPFAGRPAIQLGPVGAQPSTPFSHAILPGQRISSIEMLEHRRAFRWVPIHLGRRCRQRRWDIPLVRRRNFGVCSPYDLFGHVRCAIRRHAACRRGVGTHPLLASWAYAFETAQGVRASYGTYSGTHSVFGRGTLDVVGFHGVSRVA